jgi:hypothetical protein
MWPSLLLLPQQILVSMLFALLRSCWPLHPTILIFDVTLVSQAPCCWLCDARGCSIGYIPHDVLDFVILIAADHVWCSSSLVLIVRRLACDAAHDASLVWADCANPCEGTQMPDGTSRRHAPALIRCSLCLLSGLEF